MAQLYDYIILHHHLERAGRLTLEVKPPGKPGAGKRHAGFDEAGTGNVTRGAGLRSPVKMGELPPDTTVGAPVLDPT